ncbi:RxLR effector candidate protein [Phytophthora palmivora]|uniref:RxLR effector candidate protein n=1 Tax=Phytophthora palmivora TaxID=4796 RepID=A0A2P4YGD9_9STRA|nr:RxLR effector candidate protein [Phytophthora palmivora]
MVSNLLRPYRNLAPSFFDDIFIHSHAEGDLSAVEMHLKHLLQVFEVMRENKLYDNLKKYIFCAPEIPVLGSYVSKEGIRADPVKVETICPFHVACDASDFEIGCALMQFDKQGRAMRYALIKFRAYLLSEQTFAVYTYHAFLRTATKSHHLSQSMARWVLLFSEYNFIIHYKPGKTNILADALLRRSGYVQSGRHAMGDEDDDECVADDVTAVDVAATSPLHDMISAAYEADKTCHEMTKYLRDPSESTRRQLLHIVAPA